MKNFSHKRKSQVSRMYRSLNLITKMRKYEQENNEVRKITEKFVQKLKTARILHFQSFDIKLQSYIV